MRTGSKATTETRYFQWTNSILTDDYFSKIREQTHLKTFWKYAMDFWRIISALFSCHSVKVSIHRKSWPLLLYFYVSVFSGVCICVRKIKFEKSYLSENIQTTFQFLSWPAKTILMVPFHREQWLEAFCEETFVSIYK